MRFLFILLFALSAHADNLQDGLALSNSVVLKQLEQKGYALSDLLEGQTIGIQSNGTLSKNAVIKPVFDTIISDITAYRATNTGGGRMFDVKYLSNDSARFALVGVVNRVDLGYKSGSLCGEVRFIYRLAYSVTDKGAPVTSRLPMTINVALNPVGDCAALASAWLKVKSETATADELVNGGPLDFHFTDRKKVKTSRSTCKWFASLLRPCLTSAVALFISSAPSK